MFSSKLYLYIYNHRGGGTGAVYSTQYTLTNSTRSQFDNISVTNNK